MNKATRKTTTPEMRTSVCSYPFDASVCSRSFWSGSWPGPCPDSRGLCVDMLRLQNLRKVRVVGLHQRPRLQTCAEEGHPEGHHCHGYSHIFENPPTEVEVARGILEVGLDQPEKNEGSREDHPLAHPHQPLLVPLQVARQQERERDQPVEEEVEGNNHAPPALEAVKIPGNLLGQVPRPDDEELDRKS